MRFKGALVEWNDDRGFGFIQPAEGGPRVFCHISSFEGRRERPAVGRIVTFEVQKDRQGRNRAAGVRYSGRSGERARSTPSAGRPGVAVVVGAVFFGFLAMFAVAGRIAWLVVGWYAAASAALFLLYGWDKNAAEGGHWRTPEATLQLLALVGGWPGGWIGQQGFRHKTSKASFQVQFWLMVGLNVAALAWAVATGNDPLEWLRTR